MTVRWEPGPIDLCARCGRSRYLGAVLPDGRRICATCAREVGQ